MIFPWNVMSHPQWKSNSGWCEVSVDQRSSACSCDCFGLIGYDRPLHLDPHCASGFISQQCGNATPVLGYFSTSIHSHIPVGGCALQPSRFPRWPENCSTNPASLILSQQCPIYRHCHYGCVFFLFIAVCCKVTEKKEDWEYLQMPRNILDLNYWGTFYCSVIKMAALYTRLFANARVCAYMCVYIYWN